MDKLRYIFSLLADTNGHLIHEKYASFVQDVTRVPQGNQLMCDFINLIDNTVIKGLLHVVNLN